MPISKMIGRKNYHARKNENSKCIEQYGLVSKSCHRECFGSNGSYWTLGPKYKLDIQSHN
jgi:hypothetical protein